MYFILNQKNQITAAVPSLGSCPRTWCNLTYKHAKFIHPNVTFT